MPNPLPTDFDARLSALDGWQYADGYMAKTFTFPNFVEAFGFMARVALIAERIGHHPDWSNSYNVVHIRLRTHDADGITDKDFKLAGLVEAVLNPSTKT